MFDTHCHLNFKRFQGQEKEIIEQARSVGINGIIVPGTDVKSSFKALELAKLYSGVYAAVGIHPHHAQEIYLKSDNPNTINPLKEIETLLEHEKVVAIGEVGLDRHVYKNTKYKNYEVTNDFIKSQRELLISQIHLALEYKKSIIFHNWEAKNDLIPLLHAHWDTLLEYRAVFHCCEPDEELLQFAKTHHIFIGVDGDVTYDIKKKEFIKHIPLDMLVLETDSPYLLPEPLRSQKKYPNTPSNITLIAEYIADELHISKAEIAEITTQNARKLFNLPEDKG